MMKLLTVASLSIFPVLAYDETKLITNLRGGSQLIGSTPNVVSLNPKLEAARSDIQYPRKVNGFQGPAQTKMNTNQHQSQELVPKKIIPQAPLVKRRRKFVSYSSSDWELYWLDNVDILENSKKICDVLINEQAHYIHDYLKLLCSSRLGAPYEKWCVIDDGTITLWYNSENQESLEITFERPSEIPAHIPIPPPEPVNPGPEDSHIVSKFVFYDEVTNEHYVEYIEPLVSHLRFPLSKCITPPEGMDAYQYHDTVFRGWLIPPPPVVRGERAVYVDAGAALWNKEGSSSLQFFTDYWKRSGVVFDETFAFQSQLPASEFYQALPMEHHNTTHYRQCSISSRAEDGSKEHPFLPVFMDVNTGVNDYVLFVLDVVMPGVELGNIEFILNDPNTHVSELVWEHHVQGNYLMTEHWQANSSPASLRLSYEYFLRLRRKGIRAHSWV